MACRIECGYSGRSGILLFLSIGVFLVVSVGAQKAARPVPPKYDLQTETKIKGTIEEVKLPPKGSEKEIAHLLVKNGADTVDVYLCPRPSWTTWAWTSAREMRSRSPARKSSKRMVNSSLHGK